MIPSEKPSIEPIEDADYNTVFERLVEQSDDDEFVGTIAYGHYKFAKREWVREFHGRYGRNPTAKDYRKYAEMQTDAALDAYRARAAKLVKAYSEDLQAKQRPEILRAALRGGFWRSFWPSLFASFVFALILAVVFVVAVQQGWTFPIPLGITRG